MWSRSIPLPQTDFDAEVDADQLFEAVYVAAGEVIGINDAWTEFAHGAGGRIYSHDFW